MHNVHTCSKCSVHMITTIVLVLHSNLVKVAGDMVCRARIIILVCINAIGTRRRIGCLLFTIVGVIKTFPTLEAPILQHN
jgi:hypothetical protein